MFKEKQMIKKGERIWQFAYFLLPALFIYAVFIIYPIFSTVYYSFYDWTGLNDVKTFIGMENYRTMLADEAFRHSIVNNIWVVVVSVFIQIPLGLAMALLVRRKSRGNNILRILYFLPFLMSTVAIGLTWSFLYDPMFGVINHMLQIFGADTSGLLWLGSKELALFSVLVVVVWNYAPFYMILFIASLSTISKDYYEAASIDGASTGIQFRYITIPLLMPSIINSVVLSLVGSLKSFDLFYVMTKGGPGSSTELMGTYMYKQGFTYFKMGYASSVAFFMFFAAVISIIIVKVVQKRVSTERDI